MRAASACAVFVLAVVLGGCQGPGDRAAPHSDAPSTSSVPSRSSPVRATSAATATATAGTSGPVVGEARAGVPPAARQHTDAGAEAFVRYFFDQLNRAWTTPQAGLLPELSDPRCKSCAAFERTATQLIAARHRYAAAPALVTSVAAYGGAKPGHQLLRVQLHQNRVAIVNSEGRTVSVDSEKSLHPDVLLGWGGLGWIVLDLG